MRVQSELLNVNNKAILLDESHILDPRLLVEGPRPKKWQMEAKLNMATTIWEGKINGFTSKIK
jgi:hypothetical protein